MTPEEMMRVEPSITDMLQQYQAMARKHEGIKSYANTLAAIQHWRTAIEELGKVEALLADCINNEVNQQRNVGASLGWPARLDQILGELSRYRGVLQQRLTDQAVARLTGKDSLNQEDTVPFLREP